MTVLMKPTAVRRAFFSIPVFTFITVGAIASKWSWACYDAT
jgi:hypothetical protein